MASRWDRSETDKWRALRMMSAAQSIAIGEALLTSDLMRIAEPPRAPRPISIAIALRRKRSDAERPR